MNVWGSFTFKEIKAALIHFGCSFNGNRKGTHETWYSPKTNRLFHVIDHGRNTLPPPTTRGILEHAGIDKQEFLEFTGKEDMK